MSRLPVKRVAVIGAGPAGAIAIDALAQEKAFDLIRVFERREGPGGCWSASLILNHSGDLVLTMGQDRRRNSAAHTHRLLRSRRPDCGSASPYPGTAPGADPKVGTAPVHGILRVSVP